MRCGKEDAVEKIRRFEVFFPFIVVQAYADVRQDVCLFSSRFQIAHESSHSGVRREIVSIPVLKTEANRIADLFGGSAGHHFLQCVVFPDQSGIQHDPFTGVVDQKVDLPYHGRIGCIFPCGIVGVVVRQYPSHVKYDIFVICHCIFLRAAYLHHPSSIIAEDREKIHSLTCEAFRKGIQVSTEWVLNIRLLWDKIQTCDYR